MIKSPSSHILPITFSLILIGLVFISLSSLTEANLTAGDKYFFIKRQLFWLGIALPCFYICSKISLKTIRQLAAPLYFISLIFLILVLIPQLGNEALGAKRWLEIGNLTLQPAELLKFTSVLYFSQLFADENRRTFKKLVIYLGIPFILILLEPNLSTAILVSTIVVSIYYLSGGEIVSLFSLCLVATIASFVLIAVSPYRLARLKTLLNPDQSRTSISYHSNQIIIALTSGGLFGKGFANSDQKYRYLPKISTDSILAVIGEETGFIGVASIICLYVTLISQIFRLSLTTPNLEDSLLLAGIASWIAFQSLINLSAIVAIIPLTGVPLPFISYGGSSLLTLLSAIGLVRNIEKHS